MHAGGVNDQSKSIYTNKKNNVGIVENLNKSESCAGTPANIGNITPIIGICFGNRINFAITS